MSKGEQHAKKKTKDPNSFKFSMDLTGDNKIILENLSQNYSLKTGPMINRIIQTFCGISGSAKEAMEKICYLNTITYLRK